MSWNWEDQLASQTAQWWNNVQTNVGNWYTGITSPEANNQENFLTGLGKMVANKFDPAATGRPSTYYGMTTSPMKDSTKLGTVTPPPKFTTLPGEQYSGTIDSAPTTLNPPAPTGDGGDTYLNLLYSLLEQSKNVGGYGSALSSINKERQGINTRYKENQGDIRTMFGNLTTMRRNDIPGVSQLAEAGRATSAQQTGNIAQQTRDAEAQRLAAANEARTALGLSDIAGAAAGGDIATQASEAGLADQAALAQIGRTASEVNQNITEQAINDEIARYSTDQNLALQELGRSRTSALSDVAGREQQILMQQASAQQAAQQANIQLQTQIAGLVNEYQTGLLEAKSPKGVFAKWVNDYAGNDPAAATDATYISGAFMNWIQNADLLTNKTTNKTLDAPGAVNEFRKYVETADPEVVAKLDANPSLIFLLSGIWNTTLTKPKAE